MNALKVLASLALAATAVGQMRDNQDKQMTCDSSSHGSRARYCEVREQTIAATGLSVDPGQNGGATVKGWSRNEILVRSRVEGRADSEADARITASQVYVDTSGGHVQAQGPPSSSNAEWFVSFEIFVPQATSLTVKTAPAADTKRYDTLREEVSHD